MLKFPRDKRFETDTIHKWLVADSQLEKPKLPSGTHEKIDAMAVWASSVPKLMHGSTEQFLNSLSQGHAKVAEHLATGGVGYTAGMLIKSSLSEDIPDGPYCAAVAIGSRLGAQILTKALQKTLRPPSYETLSRIATRALSSPDWKHSEAAQVQLLEESVNFGDQLNLERLKQSIPPRFGDFKLTKVIERLGNSLEEIAKYSPETPLRKSFNAVKHKIQMQHQDFTR